MMEIIANDYDKNSWWNLDISIEKIGPKLKFNMIFHLQTNGRMERFNGIY
jgi:hypothetical protein